MQFEEVKELISIFEKTDLNDMEVQLDNAVIRLNRGPVSPWMTVQNVENITTQTEKKDSEKVSEEKACTANEQTIEASDKKVIKAPIVGTFYQSSAPDEKAFVKVGDKISQGDVVCIIEAMKFMNEVNSEVSGTVKEILVQDGDFVEYGQELFVIE